MITTYYKTTRDQSLNTINTHKKGSWINVENATAEDIQAISELAGLDFPDLDDALDIYEIPRIEREENAIIVFYAIHPQNKTNSTRKPLQSLLPMNISLQSPPKKIRSSNKFSMHVKFLPQPKHRNFCSIFCYKPHNCIHAK